MSFDIDCLRPVTRAAAYRLRTQCSWVEFTSGYRDWKAQAHAMAVNQIAKRDWVGLVYPREPQFQAWSDAHPDATLDELSEGFYEVALALPDELKARFAHPDGRAFDIKEPPIGLQHLTKSAINLLPGLQTFLCGEGGLPLWHCQFNEHPGVV